MKKSLFLLLLFCGSLLAAAWDFNGIDSRKVLRWRPAPGRFAVTIAFQLTVPQRMLTPGYRRESVFYPLVMQGVKPKKNEFQKLQMCFVAKPANRYSFAAAAPGGRYNIHWSNYGSHVPTDKPVWIFLSAAAGGIFEARIDKRNYSHIRKVGMVPLVNSAREYRICLGHNPYRGGTGFFECSINNFMLFEKVLSLEEMELIEKNPAAGRTLPGWKELK